MEGSKLGGPWNVPCLMAFGMFHAWWPLTWIQCLVALKMNLMLGGQWGSILFGGQWKVPSLVALGMFHAWVPLEGEGKTSFSPLSTFYLIRFYLNLFSIDFKELFYHYLDYYFTSFFLFPWPINYNHAFWGTKFCTHAFLSWFWSNFFFPWIQGLEHDYVLWAWSRTNEWKIA